LILSRGAALFGATLDLTRDPPVGAVVPLVEGVALDSGSGGVRHFGLSRAGTLAFAPGADAYSLLEAGANGRERVIVQSQWVLGNPRYSRDGRRIIVSASRRVGEPEDLWLHDLQTGTATRLTDDGGRAPFWTPGDATVTYSHLGRQQGIYERSADGRGEARRLLEIGSFHWLVGWTPDRSTLAYGVMEGSQSSITTLTGGTSRRIVGPGSIWGGRLSRDGKWLVYYSLDSGNFEIYVTSFPGVESRWLIGEGTDPAWAPDGSEVFYRGGGHLMAARIDKSAGVRVLSRRLVIESFQPPKYDDYDIHPDGRSLVLVQPANRLQGREVTTVLDWLTEVRRLIGGS
jgi:Tol biopolymer transport system component